MISKRYCSDSLVGSFEKSNWLRQTERISRPSKYDDWNSQTEIRSWRTMEATKKAISFWRPRWLTKDRSFEKIFGSIYIILLRNSTWVELMLLSEMTQLVTISLLGDFWISLNSSWMTPELTNFFISRLSPSERMAKISEMSRFTARS